MSELPIRWVKGMCMGTECPEKATIQLINASGMSSDWCAECTLRGNTEGLKFRPYPTKMPISERELCAWGIQASQRYEAHDRFINGSWYRFVVRTDLWELQNRRGIEVSRVVGIDDDGGQVLEKVHQFGRPVTRWGF
ncbi:hypothetical protein ABZW10_28495 [Kitasatospora sp. NPDC004723]|uniref:hypothetical protein n=1 Tax=Kitasatospora sp. NPDC004723 TaxID=3154288 RepID=UPI0033BF4C8C